MREFRPREVIRSRSRSGPSGDGVVLWLLSHQSVPVRGTVIGADRACLLVGAITDLAPLPDPAAFGLGPWVKFSRPA